MELKASMEFGTTIPLFFMTMCCIVTTPFVGLTAILFIWFRLKDKQLAKNILFTVIGVDLLVFIFPTLQLIWALIFLSQDCNCENSNTFTPKAVSEMFIAALRYGRNLMIPGITLGFIFAQFGV